MDSAPSLARIINNCRPKEGEIGFLIAPKKLKFLLSWRSLIESYEKVVMELEQIRYICFDTDLIDEIESRIRNYNNLISLVGKQISDLMQEIKYVEEDRQPEYYEIKNDLI